ncbi:MAG TPA: MlaD family protein [Candidatus Polarisedimenticolaceae bacterium]|nr:MlaD family protein [Candidatus Polarisedimenticolaceae bacterium]
MPRRPNRDLAVGVTFALALVILAITIMALGGRSNLFSAKAGFGVRFKHVEGLGVGSPVKMAGVSVGSVSSIRLPTDPKREGIEVHIEIDPDYAARVRQDSVAALRILQLLSGEKFVDIVPGSAESPPLAAGAFIPEQASPEILEQGALIADNLNDITVSLKNILNELEHGNGLISQMLRDPEFGKEGLEALRGTLRNTEALTADLRRGRGVLGRLLHDEALGGRVDHIAQSLDQLAAQLDSWKAGQGALGDVLTEGGQSDQAIADFRAAAGSLREVSARLASREGLIGKLLNDPEYSAALAADLRTTLDNLASISGKLERGEGTLGALISERTLYDGMQQIVTGVHDSKFANWLLRHYQKKGIKAGAPASPPDAEPPSPR